MNRLVTIAAGAIGVGLLGYALVRRSHGAPAASSATKPVFRMPGPRVRAALRPRKPLQMVPGLAVRLKAEPGLERAIQDVAAETGADVDKLVAFISTRSNWDPKWAGFVEGHGGGEIFTGILALDAAQDSREWNRPAAGLMGFTEDQQSGVRSLDHIQQMSAIDQVRGPLRSMLKTYPWIAQDPAMFALWGTGLPYVNRDMKPSVAADLPGMANTTPVVRRSDGDYWWDAYGKYAKEGSDVVRLGDIRRHYYETSIVEGP